MDKLLNWIRTKNDRESQYHSDNSDDSSINSEEESFDISQINTIIKSQRQPINLVKPSNLVKPINLEEVIVEMTDSDDSSDEEGVDVEPVNQYPTDVDDCGPIYIRRYNPVTCSYSTETLTPAQLVAEPVVIDPQDWIFMEPFPDIITKADVIKNVPMFNTSYECDVDVHPLHQPTVMDAPFILNEPVEPIDPTVFSPDDYCYNYDPTVTQEPIDTQEITGNSEIDGWNGFSSELSDSICQDELSDQIYILDHKVIDDYEQDEEIEDGEELKENEEISDVKEDKNQSSENMHKLSAGKLELYVGPMFSGKTTRVTTQLALYADVGWNALYINHSSDIRVVEAQDSTVTTHSSQFKGLSSKVSACKAQTLGELRDVINEYDVIGIDEGHSFLIYIRKSFIGSIMDISMF